MNKVLWLVPGILPALLHAQLQEPLFNPKKVVPYVASGPETVTAMLSWRASRRTTW